MRVPLIKARVDSFVHSVCLKKVHYLSIDRCRWVTFRVAFCLETLLSVFVVIVNLGCRISSTGEFVILKVRNKILQKNISVVCSLEQQPRITQSYMCSQYWIKWRNYFFVNYQLEKFPNFSVNQSKDNSDKSVQQTWSGVQSRRIRTSLSEWASYLSVLSPPSNVYIKRTSSGPISWPKIWSSWILEIIPCLVYTGYNTVYVDHHNCKKFGTFYHSSFSDSKCAISLPVEEVRIVIQTVKRTTKHFNWNFKLTGDVHQISVNVLKSLH